MLNGQPMGGKRRSAYHFDLWCLKYLPKFQWEALTEDIGECVCESLGSVQQLDRNTRFCWCCKQKTQLTQLQCSRIFCGHTACARTSCCSDAPEITATCNDSVHRSMISHHTC